MNTTAKGTLFEDRAYTVLSSALSNKRLWAAPQFARIYRKQPYHSRDRGKDIITDISIELFLTSPSDPSLIWVFECKDYSTGRIPIDDVEEFHAKLEQIAQDKTKGTIITNGALEGSAINYAQAKGIGLIRLLPDNQIVHVMSDITMQSARSTSSAQEVQVALTSPTHKSQNSFFADFDGYVFGSWYSMLSHAIDRNA